MNFSTRTLLAGVLAAGSLAFGIPAAQAQPFEHGRAMHAHQMRDGGGMRMLRGLDLTEAQRDQIFKIFHDQAPAMRERMKAARSAQEELRKAATAPTFDSARVRQLADAAGKAHADAAYARAETMSKVAGLLTPEQRAKLNEIRERGPRRGPRS